MSDEWGRPIKILLNTTDGLYYTRAIRSLLVVVEGQTTHIFTDDVRTADLIVVDTLDRVKKYESAGKPIAFIVSSREYLLVKSGVHTMYLGNFLIALRDLIWEIYCSRRPVMMSNY